MIEAILHIASENYYSCKFTKIIPVRVHLITINGPEGFGIIESLDGTEKPLKKYARFMKRSPNIIEFEITYRSENQYWTKTIHQIDGPSIHQTILESGCMSRLPIVIASGFQTHSVLAPSQNEYSELFHKLRRRFSSVELVSLRRYASGLSNSILTSKQEEAFKVAFKQGYYQIPRQCEIQQLTKYFGIKRVALQERLRRAERKIMNEFARNLGL